MKKKIVASLLVCVLMVVSLAACGNNSNDKKDDNGSSSSDNGGSSASSDNKDAIRILNGKIEIDTALKDFAKEYEAETGQEIIIESLGGGVDIAGQIKNYKAAGNMPDIFNFGGEGEYETFKDLMADLDDEEWLANTDFAFVGPDGRTTGFPYSIEGYGITYNADILKEAGVNPEDLVNYAAYEDAFKKIDAKKDDLGIDAVVAAAAESGQMFWSTGNHMFGYYLSGGLERTDTKYIDMMKDGEIDEDRLTQFGKFTEMVFEYSDKNTLISGTYDDQLALWAQGKAAFIIQGNWIDPSLPTYDVEFDCGIAPFAFTEEDMTGVLADSPSWWAVHSEGDKVDACKDILKAIVNTDFGVNAFVKEAALVSPHTTVTETPDTPLAISLSSYIADDNTYAWEWTKMPEGIAQNSLGMVFELLAKGDLDVDGFVKMMESEIANYVQ